MKNQYSVRTTERMVCSNSLAAITKKEVKEFVRKQLGTNSKWALKALITIYDHQTAHEQNIGATTEYNGVGFSGIDSEFLSSLAVKYIQYGELTDKQMTYVFKYMPKYWRQIIAVSDQNKLREAIVADYVTEGITI